MDGALRAFRRVDDDELSAAVAPRQRTRSNAAARRSTALDPTALATLAAAVRPFQQRVRESEAAKRRPVPHERADQRILSGPALAGSQYVLAFVARLTAEAAREQANDQ